MEGYCLVGQSPQWAVVPMEEEQLNDHTASSRYKRKLNGLTSTVALLNCSRTKVGQQVIVDCGASVVRCPLLSNLFYSEIIKHKGV